MRGSSSGAKLGTNGFCITPVATTTLSASNVCAARRDHVAVVRPSSARRRSCRSAREARSALRTPRGSRPSRASSGRTLVAPGSACPEARRRPPVSTACRESQRLRHGVADPLARVEDHERATPLRQVVARREPGLATADDHRLESSLSEVPSRPPRRCGSTVGRTRSPRIARIHQPASERSWSFLTTRRSRRGRARRRTRSPLRARRARASRRCSGRAARPCAR